ncbi:MAG: hypothetical protein HY291_08045 [Planctomycetes bacterium]|nr:hypothetical protein [Planctomycetota bacterium]
MADRMRCRGTWRQKLAWRAAAIVLLLAAASSILRADGFHLTNFRYFSVSESWIKIKTELQFPELPAGKTWSDVCTLGEFQKDDQKRGLVASSEQMLALRVVVTDMVEVLKYCGTTYMSNCAPDSPPWMFTAKTREKAMQDTMQILAEIGWQATPYLLEALELDDRFQRGPNGDALRKFCAAWVEETIADDALRSAVAAKSAEYKQAEAQFQASCIDLMKTSWKEVERHEALIREVHQQKARLETLQAQAILRDPALGKVADSLQALREKTGAARGKAPAEFFQFYRKELFVAEDYADRLRGVIISYGERARPYLQQQTLNTNPVMHEEAVNLLARIDRALKAAQAIQNPPPPPVQAGAKGAENELLPGEKPMGNPMSPAEDQADPNPWIEKKKQEFEALQKTGEKTAKVREELVKAIRASDEILAKLSELQKAEQTPETKAQIADLQKQLAKAQQKEYALKLEEDDAEAKLREARKHFTEEEPKKPAP